MYYYLYNQGKDVRLLVESERSGFSVPKGKKVCSVCGEVKRLSSFEEGSDRCISCGEKMLKTPVKWYVIPLVSAFAVVAVIAVYLTVLTVPFIRNVEKARNCVSEGCFYDAFDIYENEIISNADEIDGSLKEKFGFLGEEKFFIPGTKTFEEYCKITAMADSEYEAGVLAKSFFKKDCIEKNEVFSDYVSAMNAYDKVFARIQEVNEKYTFTSAEDLKYDEIMSEFEALQEKCESDYEKGYVEYFKASVTLYKYGGKDELVGKIKPYLDEMLRYVPGEYAVYGSTLAEAAFGCEDYDTVIEAARFVTDKNKDISIAYEWLAEAYYKKGEKEKAFEAIEELNKYVPSSPTYYKLLIKYNLLEGDMEAADKASFEGDSENSEFVDTVFNMYLSNNSGQITRMARQVFSENIEFSAYQSILLLLQGDKTTAFEIAYNYAYYYAYYYAYLTGDSSLLTQGIINVTTLCAELCRDSEALEDISQFGMCDETTQKIIDGELSLEDVFIDGKAEII